MIYQSGKYDHNITARLNRNNFSQKKGVINLNQYFVFFPISVPTFLRKRKMALLKDLIAIAKPLLVGFLIILVIFFKDDDALSQTLKV